jgi:CBS domain-containing protein
MNSKSTIYFSQLLGRRAFIQGDGAVGRVTDLVADIGQMRPRIVALIVGSGAQARSLDFSACRIEGSGRSLQVWAQSEEAADLGRENLLYLKKHLLDKQIVDVDGRKLVRVNDLVIEVLPSGVYLVAVDVGLEGLLRRLDLEKPLAAILKAFKRPIPSKLILWKEVEAVDFPRMEIKLSTAYSKLATFHPSDLADILEDLDHNSQMALFQSLDEERAADVLEEMEPEAQVSLLEAMPVGKAADLLEKMPADEVADIMDELGKAKAESLLSEMESDSSREVRTLMEYPENTVGSLMSTDFLVYPETATVDGVLRDLRAKKPEAETIYYLYVVDSGGRYLATVPLRDLVVAEPGQPLSGIMNPGLEALNDGDDVYSIAELLLKYKLHAVPVVDQDRAMVGTIVIEDVLEHVMSLRRRK